MKTIFSFKSQESKLLLGILVLGAITRLILLFNYEVPSFAPDSNSYKELASFLSKGTLVDYPGWRTPGYPLLLFASLGKYYGIVIAIQSLMNIATTYLVYDLIRIRRPRIALVASLLFYTLMRTVFYEFFIVTETTTTFLLTLIVWYISKHQIIEIKSSYKQTIILSLLLCAIFLVRPMFVYICVILAFFMSFHLSRKKLYPGIKKILIILILPLTFYFGWNTLNYINNDWFTTTSYAGITKAQCAMTFFDKVPDEHAVIRDIYLKHINETENIKRGIFNYQDKYNIKSFQRMQENGAYESIESLSIWRAYRELIEATGLNGVELSRELNEICTELIKNNPGAYFHQVWRGWLGFWKNNDIPINYKLAKNKSIVETYRSIMDVQKYLFNIINILLIPALFLCIYKNIKNGHFFNFELFIFALIGAASLAQAMVTFGEGARFAYPFIGLILLSVSSLTAKEH